jgi:hypothetical protein
MRDREVCVWRGVKLCLMLENKEMHVFEEDGQPFMAVDGRGTLP